jgi:sulfopyruvate decarboxylase TPP-binding subunit
MFHGKAVTAIFIQPKVPHIANLHATYFKLPLLILIQIQGDQKVSVHLMITIQQAYKNILNSFNHLP